MVQSMPQQLLTIREVATRTGVNRNTLRLYEARGIVSKPRRTPAYRVYEAHDRPAPLQSRLASNARRRSCISSGTSTSTARPATRIVALSVRR